MKNYKKFVTIIMLLVTMMFCMANEGCDNSNDKENRTVERQQRVYVDSQPAPFFTWSFERHLFRQLYIKRNSAVMTYSYIISDFGKILYETPSIGYPIPADTQLTNPLMVARGFNGGQVVEQPEPNGLFTSKNTNATYVMAVNEDGDVLPIYSEPKVIAFPFPVETDANGKFVRKKGSTATIKLDTGKVGEVHHPAFDKK